MLGAKDEAAIERCMEVRDGDEDDNIKHMWEHVKRAIVESTRDVCGSVRVGGGTKSVCGGTMR